MCEETFYLSHSGAWLGYLVIGEEAPPFDTSIAFAKSPAPAAREPLDSSLATRLATVHGSLKATRSDGVVLSDHP